MANLKSCVLFLLFGSAFFIGCEKAKEFESPRIININYIYVEDSEFSPVAEKEILSWLKQIQEFYHHQTGINIEFKGRGKLSIEDFFNELTDPQLKDPSRFSYSLPPDLNILENNKSKIVSFLKREDLDSLKTLVNYYSNIKGQTVEELFEIIKISYLNSLSKVIENHLLDLKHYKYRIKANWELILANKKDYWLVITNAPVIENSIEPTEFYLYMGGAISKGFSYKGKASLISTFDNSSASAKKVNNNLMPLIISHELGHSIFYFSDDLRESSSFMSYITNIKKSTDDKLQFELTKIEKSQAKSAFPMYLAMLAAEKGDYQKAVQNYELALSITPGFPNAYEDLAKLYIKVEDYSKAERILQEAIKIHPDRIEYFIMLGDLYLSSSIESDDRINKGITLYKKAISLNPYLIRIRFNLAYSYESAGLTNDAIREYKEILLYDKNNIMALKQLGLIFSRNNNCREMITLYEEVLKVEPNYAEAYYRMGLCMKGMDQNNARNFFKKYLLLEPDGEYSEMVKRFLRSL